MDTRKVSAAVGFSLLMGCVVSVFVVIYNNGGGKFRGSYHSTVEESWKKRELWLKGRQEVLGSPSTPTTTLPNSSSSSSVKETKKLANELHKLFKTKGTTTRVSPPFGERVKSVQKPVKIDTQKTTDKAEEPNNTHGEKEIGRSENISSILESIRSTQPPIFHPDVERQEVNSVMVSKPNPFPTEQESEFRHPYETPSVTNRRLPKPFQLEYGSHLSNNKRHYKSNILLVQSPSSSSLPSLNEKKGLHRHLQLPFIFRSTPTMPHFHFNMSNTSTSDTDEEYYYEDPGEYDFIIPDDVGTPDNIANTHSNRRPGPKDPVTVMRNMLQLVTDAYKNGGGGMDASRLIKIINETVHQTVDNGLLTQLNQPYIRPATLAGRENGNDTTGLRNSLSAFLFMSFGVFLLNQIHNLMGKEEDGARAAKGRQERMMTLNHPHSELDLDTSPSRLDFLFQPPSFFSPNLHNVSSNGEKIIAGDNDNAREISGEGSPPSWNNIFRAAVNLVNAYTKHSSYLECIWSHYCQELDKVSAQAPVSLYSIAARINSVGLRLVTGQIPTKWTADVVLRSLLGWDGLPCSNMFSKCQMVPQQEEEEKHNRTSTTPSPSRS